MKYISTRGNCAPVSFNQAITQGLAPDGGLYVPQEWPKLDAAILAGAKDAPYFETAAQILSLFAGDDIDIETARKICKSAYGNVWADAEITPLRKLNENTHLLELFHGPSLAFKDVAMQMIGALYEHILGHTNQNLSIICATSGDTGGAAVEAFKNRKHISLYVLMPDGRVSEVQKRFMTASGADNVHALILDGDFDNAQGLLKGLFSDKKFVQEVNLAPVNSVNFARIVAQCVYFVIAAAKLGTDNLVDFIVPTGNFGDAFSGFAAKTLGAKIGNIIIANNANNAISNALETGEFNISSHSLPTISPAMDIQVASNFERIIYELGTGSHTERAESIRTSYVELAANRKFELPAKTHANLHLHFKPSTIDDAQTRVAIKDCLSQTGQVICPHTAVAWASRNLANPNREKVILATAHAAKFPETIEETIKLSPALPPHAEDLFSRPEKFDKMVGSDAGLKQYIREKA